MNENAVLDATLGAGQCRCDAVGASACVCIYNGAPVVASVIVTVVIVGMHPATTQPNQRCVAATRLE